MATTKWIADPTHSEISFKIRHLMITNVTGYFRKFSVELETQNDDFDSVTKVIFIADINSIDTANEARDNHLKSADFFNEAEFPHIKFIGNHLQKTGAEGKLNGDLTIRDVTRPVVLDIEYGGIVSDGYGQTKAGFTLRSKVSRKEFGLTWNATTETGGIVAGDEIKITGEIQLIKTP
jgi:polyisoprenoid-binding protein YceI